MQEILVGLVLGAALLLYQVLSFWLALSWGCRTVAEAGGDAQEYLREVERAVATMPQDGWM